MSRAIYGVLADALGGEAAKVLQYAGDLDQAVEMIKRTQRTVGLNVMIADGKSNRAVIVEIAANRYAVRKAKDGVIYATNRYRASWMQSVQGGGWLGSALRGKQFEEIFAAEYGRIDLKTTVEVLRDKFAEGTPAHDGFVSPGIDNQGTLAGLVFLPAAVART